MARSCRFPVLLVLAVVAAAAAAFVPTPASATGGGYCRDSLSGLLTCHDFMFEGAPTASPACCAAYNAVFVDDAFCLCYIANGVYGRATGYDVNVTRAMEIPVSCGLDTPPIELCDMEGVVLPPYEPSAQPPAAATPGQSPVASAPSPQLTTPPPPSTSQPPPPPTSNGVRGYSSVVGGAVTASLVLILAVV